MLDLNVKDTMILAQCRSSKQLIPILTVCKNKFSSLREVSIDLLN